MTLSPMLRWIPTLVLAGFSMSGCAAIQEQACAARVKEHLDSFESTYAKVEVQSIEQVRTYASSLHAAASTAPVQGCSSQVALGVAELKSSAEDLQTALSDEQVVVAGLFTLFGAGETSPLMKKLGAAKERYEAARRLLAETTN